MIRYDEVAGLGQDISGRGRIERTLTGFSGLALTVLAVYLVDMNSSLSLLHLLGVQDTDTLDLIACPAAASIGLIATIYLEKKRPQVTASEKYHYWMQTIIRYFLAYIFLLYGFAKVFHEQFYSSLSTLDTPLGDVSGIQLTWRFFGYSYAYTLFVAASQIVSSILFFFRRTTTLGAMILLSVVSNIVFVNFSHQIPVKLYSCIYLIMVLYLLLIDHRRLKALFWDNKPFDGRVAEFPKNRKLAIVKYVVILILISNAVIDSYYAHITYAKVTTPLYGAWEVEKYQVNDVSRQPDSDPFAWKKVYFESDKLLSIKFGQPKARRFFWALDSENHTISFEDLATENLFLEGSYEMESDDKMIIKASAGEDTIQVTLNRVKKTDS